MIREFSSCANQVEWVESAQVDSE